MKEKNPNTDMSRRSFLQKMGKGMGGMREVVLGSLLSKFFLPISVQYVRKKLTQWERTV